jgi:hypothetical protein
VSSTTRLNVAALQLPGKVWVGEAPREPVRRLGSGDVELDRLLGGGLPRGDVSVIVGPRSSGRTALAWTLLAAATRGGEVVAVVDLPDALHPSSLDDARACLGRVLWVRPPTLPSALKSAELILDAGGFGAVVLDLDTPAARRFPGHVWPRLRRDARRSGAALVVLSPHELAGSFAGVRIALAQKQVLWSRRVFNGFASELLPQRGSSVRGRMIFTIDTRRSEECGLRSEGCGAGEAVLSPHSSLLDPHS